MASTIEGIEALIRGALVGGYRGRLLERGLARSMIWQDGELPQDAPKFARSLSYDLLSYGYSLLSLSLRLKELGGNDDLCREAFEKSASAISDVVDNGDPDNLERGFHAVLSASTYHLGRYSAKAYSLINRNLEEENLSEIERMLCLLILRRFDELESAVINWKLSGNGADETLAENIETELNGFSEAIDGANAPQEYGVSSVEIPIINQAITDNYFSSIFEFIFALEIGNQALKDSSVRRMQTSLSICGELNLLPQWWVLRITKYLIDDLWESSLHRVVPVTPDHPNSDEWAMLRWLFIASLYKRKKSEIDLWPSQVEGAKRAVNDLDDLVISLPTSAGKTRIAELCILRNLALGKRILFITPLRALSAQTEASLRKTFLPLGQTISTLYGSIGTSDFEQDVLKSKDIVVGTPEKLDFALRNDPSLIDDVGLVILDEGHMIGLNEREIRYEVQIQRLLKREDSESRRIVCLSAILPDGNQFEDFVNWLRKDADGGAVMSSWRPTDLRFGEAVWQANSGQINFMIGEETPFIPRFVQPFVPPQPNPGYRTKEFPASNKELTLATAWNLTDDGHTVLIYCPLKISVNSFAKDIVDLHKRAALGSVLSVPMEKIELALSLGKEWLGETHPIVECLKIGVAVHHGNLPTPFRKEMEKLLREGVLRITISSPTLAQGLNLAATAVIIYSLTRNRKTIDPSEFKNVIGRAGRAFIDTQGIVLYPIFEQYNKNHRKWVNLISDTNARNMESGLVLLVTQLLVRMKESLGSNDIDELLEYVINNKALAFPEIEDENEVQEEENKNAWKRHVVNLDTAILSMLGSEDVEVDDLADTLDSVLDSSLWERRLNRHNNEDLKNLFESVLTERAKHIWGNSTASQRRGYFLAGVGLETGFQLDAIAPQVNVLLVNANGYILNGDHDAAIATIIQLADFVFAISPFSPDNLPNNWKAILTCWLQGKTLTEEQFTNIDDALQFVEDGLIYRLPWGLEAIRVRASANNDIFNDGTSLEDYELGVVVPSIENGTLNRSAAMLMQAGFSSRKAAIRAIESTNANFTNGTELKAWLKSDQIFNLAIVGDWPTPETSSLWWDFAGAFQPSSETIWSSLPMQIPVTWHEGFATVPGAQMKLWGNENDLTQVLSSEGENAGYLNAKYSLCNKGIYYVQVNGNPNFIDVTYWGPSADPFKIH